MVEKRGTRTPDLESDKRGVEEMSPSLLPLPFSAPESPGGLSHRSLKLLSLNDEEEHEKYYVKPTASSPALASAWGYKFLFLLAIQSTVKNLVLRFVMRDQPKFLISTAVIGVQVIRMALCVSYILFVEKQSFSSILIFLRDDWRNSFLLLFPASAYSIQMIWNMLHWPI